MVWETVGRAGEGGARREKWWREGKGTARSPVTSFLRRDILDSLRARTMARSKEATRGAMTGLYDIGLSVREIDGQLGVPKSTVQRWTSRYPVGQLLTDRPRPGRNRVTTPEQVAQMVDMCTNAPLTKRDAMGMIEEVSFHKA